jgi:hypothetical protein
MAHVTAAEGEFASRQRVIRREFSNRATGVFRLDGVKRLADSRELQGANFTPLKLGGTFQRRQLRGR